LRNFAEALAAVDGTQRALGFPMGKRASFGMLVAALLVTAPAGAKPRRNADENMSGRRELGMANCPSAVGGAITEVADLPNGVVVTVSAPDDPIAAQEIRRRARFQLEIAEQPERGAIEHTGLGTGSGRYGYCPGMLENARFDVQWTADGARLFVRLDGEPSAGTGRAGFDQRTANDAVKQLQRDTRRRAAYILQRRRVTVQR
jgi:hypothetical protein